MTLLAIEASQAASIFNYRALIPAAGGLGDADAEEVAELQRRPGVGDVDMVGVGGIRLLPGRFVGGDIGRLPCGA